MLVDNLDADARDRFFSCLRKIAHGSRKTAEEAAAEMRRRSPGGRERFSAYRCRHCGQYHTGHAR